MRNLRQAPFTRAVTLSATRPELDLSQATLRMFPDEETLILHLEAKPYRRLSENAAFSVFWVTVVLSCIFGSGSAWWALVVVVSARRRGRHQAGPVE